MRGQGRVLALMQLPNRTMLVCGYINKRFDAYISLAADNVSKLRNSDVFRVLSAAKSTKELTALVAYIKGNNPALSSTLDEDAKDVKEEKGW